MAKNLIPKIAEMLGVGLGEEFEIKGRKGVAYKFIIDELIVSGSNNAEHGYTSANMVLVSLVRGDAEIVKLPWKPRFEDEFYTFTLVYGKWKVCTGWWENEPHYYALLDKGWIYRSRAEAEAALPAVAAEMGVEYEL